MNQPLSPPASPHAPCLADLLIRAGAIYSMAQDRAVSQAIAIRDEWIVAVSQDPHGLDGLISADTHVLDAPDLTLLPAVEDTHDHLMLAAQNTSLVPVDRADTLAEFIDLIRQRAAQTPPGAWIQTSAAWHEVNLAEGRLPSAPELDEATPNHPVLVRRGGHVVVANSLALTLGGITRDTPDPPGGTILRFPDGTPTGVLNEPYVNNLGYRGHLLWNPDDLLTIINFAVRRGWKIGTHAIGDRAVRTLLDVYEQVIKENPGLRPGTLVLEHGFLADARQRARAIRLGVPVTIQHPLLYTLGSVLLAGWGEQRTRASMPVRAWLDEGASLSAGTDHPVSSFNPLL